MPGRGERKCRGRRGCDMPFRMTVDRIYSRGVRSEAGGTGRDGVMKDWNAMPRLYIFP